jgi:uncharacterized membrane protein YeiB
VFYVFFSLFFFSPFDLFLPPETARAAEAERKHAAENAAAAEACAHKAQHNVEIATSKERERAQARAVAHSLFVLLLFSFFLFFFFFWFILEEEKKKKRRRSDDRESINSRILFFFFD